MNVDYGLYPIPFFSLAEMRCKCGCGLVIIQPVLLIATYNVRLHHGAPVISGSWTRCTKHNRAVGGKRDSYHPFGKANDLYPQDGMSDLFRLLCRVYFPYVKDYSWGCHCDIRGRRGL